MFKYKDKVKYLPTGYEGTIEKDMGNMFYSVKLKGVNLQKYYICRTTDLVRIEEASWVSTGREDSEVSTGRDTDRVSTTGNTDKVSTTVETGRVSTTNNFKTIW